MDNEKIIATSKLMFRNHCQDENGEQMLSVANRDSSSIAISSLKTFSCDSDVELIDDNFDSQSYFAINTSENGTIHTKQRSQDQRKADPMQQQQYYNCDLQPAIVTPPKPCTIMLDISLDPLPESQLHPLLLHVGTTTIDDQKSSSEKESGLLFPSSDPYCPTTTTPGYKAPVLFESSHHHNHDYHANVGLNNDTLITRNICETYVYKQLWSSLPLPESFRPILYLLLHMEFSSTIHGTVLKHACEIINEQWKQEEARDELCTTTSKRRSSNGRNIQNISGKIVDKLVGTLGPRIDLPVLFKASAQTYNNLAATDEDDRLSIFFRKGISASKPEKTELQAINDDMAIKSSAGYVYPAGQKRKVWTNDNADDDEKIAFKKNRIEFVPSVLQLGIAYGANYYSTDDVIKSDQVMSLEYFVKTTSSHLQCMDPMEQKKEWNTMMKAWDDR